MSALLTRSRAVAVGLVPERLSVARLPPRLHLRRDGATEALADIGVDVPGTRAPGIWAPGIWATPTPEEEALLRRYLPPKRPRASAADSATTALLATIRWRLPMRDCDAMLGAYRESSIAHGRSAADTDLRIARIVAYADAVRGGARFPPIVLYSDGPDLIMLDGARRVLAHLVADRSSIPAILAVPTTRLRKSKIVLDA